MAGQCNEGRVEWCEFGQRCTGTHSTIPRILHCSVRMPCGAVPYYVVRCGAVRWGVFPLALLLPAI